MKAISDDFLNPKYYLTSSMRTQIKMVLPTFGVMMTPFRYTTYQRPL